MRVKHKETGTLGNAWQFNPHGIGEMIVQYDKGDMSSDFCTDYLFLLNDKSWVEMKDSRIIPNNSNTEFREAKNQDEINAGYY